MTEQSPHALPCRYRSRRRTVRLSISRNFTAWLAAPPVDDVSSPRPSGRLPPDAALDQGDADPLRAVGGWCAGAMRRIAKAPTVAGTVTSTDRPRRPEDGPRYRMKSPLAPFCCRAMFPASVIVKSAARSPLTSPDTSVSPPLNW